MKRTVRVSFLSSSSLDAGVASGTMRAGGMQLKWRVINFPTSERITGPMHAHMATSYIIWGVAKIVASEQSKCMVSRFESFAYKFVGLIRGTALSTR